jgi:D-alanyl-lipoteichoic acid acyltransferase DltB (MBOAT superfamily)
MLFNSAIFLFLFLPLTLIGYFVLGAIRTRAAALWLVVSSLVFYANWNPPFVILLAASVAVNYTFSVIIRHFSERPALQSATLAVAVTTNLLVLVYFKYLFPLLGWLASLGIHTVHSNDNVILPLGISFFTFTQLGYLIDMRAGGIKERGPVNYALFVTFFPHLIAGPILHHREIMPQFARPETYRLNVDDVSAGLTLFVIGLAKKRFVADNMAPLADAVYGQPHGVALPLAWLGALAYSLQIYFDFSGYSDMAIGLARMFGVRFPINFNSPYKATSIIDFWQRWHMTLTRYLTAYLYNPAVLWVTRRRLARGKPVSRKAVASTTGFIQMITLPMFYTMILAGVWHGAGFQFLIFGLLHGFYLTVNHAWRVFRTPVTASAKSNSTNWASIALNVLLTYGAVLVAQVFFRADSVHDALQVLAGMSGMHGLQLDTSVMNSLHWTSAARWSGLLAVCFACVWSMPNSNEILDRFEGVVLPPPLQGALYAALLFVVVLGSSGPPVQFLYFQF